MENIIRIIKKNQLFSGVSEENIKNISKDIKYYIKTYNKGEIIAHEDDECRSLSLVLSGVVEIQRLYLNGKYIVLNRLNEGDVFGEALVFSKLSNKVFILNSKIKSISFKSVRQKVIGYILNEVKEQKSNSIMLKNTKEEIAALLAIPRPSLSRELINLRNLGYIKFDRKKITVLDIESLEEELFN